MPLFLREQVPEERIDTLGPRLFLMSCALRFEVFKVLVQDPPLGHERVAQLPDLGRHGIGGFHVETLCRADIEPDLQGRSCPNRLHLSQDYLFVPIDRWREDGELSKRVRVLETQIDGDEPTIRSSSKPRIL